MSREEALKHPWVKMIIYNLKDTLGREPTEEEIDRCIDYVQGDAFLHIKFAPGMHANDPETRRKIDEMIEIKADEALEPIDLEMLFDCPAHQRIKERQNAK